MGTEKINRLKIVLVEQGKTGKWLAGQLGKNEATVSRWCSNTSQPSLEMLMKIAFQYEPAIIGNANEDSYHIECRCEKIDQ